MLNLDVGYFLFLQDGISVRDADSVFWLALRGVFFKECTIFTNDVKAYISQNLVDDFALVSGCHMLCIFNLNEREAVYHGKQTENIHATFCI